MIRGKARDTAVVHDPGVSLRHEKDAVHKNRSHHRWVAWQSLNPNTVSSPLHELDRATAIASNDPGVIAEETAADADWQEQHDREIAMETIRSLYPPDCGSERESAKTLFLAVYECGWETLPTPILVKMAELQLAEEDRQINASLANRW